MGSLRRLGRGAVDTMGNRQGIVPSRSRSDGAFKKSHQSSRGINHSPLPPFKFGSRSFSHRSKLEGKLAFVGKGSKAKSRSAALAEAKVKGSHHGSRTKVPLGDFLARKNDGVVTGNACANQSQSDHEIGLV